MSTPPPGPPPIGVVLAGGRASRLGGRGKSRIDLAGRPLLWWPLQAARAALVEVAVVAKRDSELPPLPGVAVWREPDEPRHPLTGVIEALRRADGRSVVVLAGDLPLVPPPLVAGLVAAAPGPERAVVTRGPGGLEPLLARYEPAAGPALARLAAGEPGLPMREAVRRLGARELGWDDPEALLNVNTPEDLARAAAALGARGDGASRRSPTSCARAGRSRGR